MSLTERTQKKNGNPKVKEDHNNLNLNGENAHPFLSEFLGMAINMVYIDNYQFDLLI